MSKNKGKSRGHDLWQFRNTVEGIYIAIILAFVLRAFMVEAFVIPTGSMANALYGEHYRLQCPACGHEYAYGYFPGDNDTGQRGVSVPLKKPRAPRNAVCPNCGYAYATDELEAPKVRGSGGDRVVVMKYLYDFAGPKPWDVVVFKNPQNNRENYIKRLIGLPGETLEIVLGDVFVKEKGSDEWKIRRKPEYAQSDMWLVVYDNDFMPTGVLSSYIHKAPEWEVLSFKARGPEIQKDRRFDFDGQDVKLVRFVPGEKNPELGPLRPVNGYNPPQAEQMTISAQLDVCTDWKLSAVIFGDGSNTGKAEFNFELRGRKYRATFDLSGRVELAMGFRGEENQGKWAVTQMADHAFDPEKGSQIELRHVDMLTSLWVGGKQLLSIDDTVEVKTPDGVTVQPSGHQTAEKLATMPEMLRRASAEVAELQAKNSPEKLNAAQKNLDDLKRLWEWYQNPAISISGSGGKFSLAHVKIMRDVYYTSPRISTPHDDSHNYDYVRKMLEQGGKGPNSWKRDQDGNFLGWGVTGNPITLREFTDEPDRNEYYCLGDNSPQSFDCRSWIAAAPTLKLTNKNEDFAYQLGTVPRYNIIGRAFFVFWPGGFSLPVLEMPIVPNAGRMRFIR